VHEEERKRDFGIFLLAILIMLGLGRMAPPKPVAPPPLEIRNIKARFF